MRHQILCWFTIQIASLTQHSVRHSPHNTCVYAFRPPVLSTIFFYNQNPSIRPFVSLFRPISPIFRVILLLMSKSEETFPVCFLSPTFIIKTEVDFVPPWAEPDKKDIEEQTLGEPSQALGSVTIWPLIRTQKTVSGTLLCLSGSNRKVYIWGQSQRP